MRIINKDVIGCEPSDLADEFFKSVCPLTKKKKYHLSYAAGKLEKLATKKGKYKKVYKYLFNHVETLFKGTPSELNIFNENFKEYLENEGIYDYLNATHCKKTLNEVFVKSYTGFRGGNNNKYITKWFENLYLATCPYCNRNWITQTLDKKGIDPKNYFDVDHFFPKVKYPWLALSFYNLIPTCIICNQRIKHSGELDLKNFLHPYLDDMDQILKFNVPVDSLDIFFDPKVKLKLEIIPRSPRDINDKDFKRAKATYDFFNLQNLYNTHLDYIRELVQKEIIYSPQYIEQLYADYGPGSSSKIFESKEDLIKMIFGNYVLPEHIHKRPLAKLTKDLIADFSIKHL